MHKILPSLLSCDPGNIFHEVEIVRDAGADWLHIDVMDGHFVPNLTFGPAIIRTMKLYFPDLKMDVHLMITNAELTYGQYIDAGADMITVHVEAVTHLHRLIQHIRERNVLAGIVLNPATSVVIAEPVLEMIDVILLMSVNPGFAAQRFIPDVLKKVKYLAQWKKERGCKYIIEMDGGINSESIPLCVENGAEWLVAGHAVFGNKAQIAESFQKLCCF